MSKTKKIITAVSLVWLSLLLVVFTYSWVVRNLTPSITQEELRISSSGALVISLDGDDNYNEINLNQIVSLESFVFKQVSSSNGRNFLWLDFTPTLEGNPAVYRYIDDNSTQKNNYVDTKFAIKLDDSLDQPKYVFLHPDCSITDDSDSLDIAKAIRIALDYDVTNPDGSVDNYTYILGNTENGAPVDLNTNAVKKDSDGKSVDDLSATEQQTIYNFSYFNGGRTGPYNNDDPSDPENYNFTPDEKKCLLKIDPGVTQWINLRIWLEGADENCVNEIAGKNFNMVLKFDSVAVPQS